MLRWDSYRTVYGAELRAAAREYSDHGWPVVGACSAGLLLATGTSLDVLEVPAAVGRLVCAQLRAAGIAVPVAATPTGRWWFPVTTGGALPAAAGRTAPTSSCTPTAPPSSPRRRRPPTAGSTGGWRPRSPATVRHRSVRSSRRSSPLSRCTKAPASPSRSPRASSPARPRCRGSSGPRRGHRGAHKMVRRPRGHFSLAARPHPPSRPGPVVRGHRPRPEPAPARGGHYGVVQTTPAPAPPVRTPPPHSVGAAAAARRRRGRAGRRRPRRQGARPAPDEDAGHRAPAGRDRGLPARPLGRGRRRARTGWATSAPRPRPAWSARWPTGSPSPRSSGGRWACRSRTPRSSRARRTQLGDSLGDFVGENFLAEDVVRDKLGRVEVARRVGEWIGQGRQRRARHRRARHRRARASSPCCATRTCRRSSTRSWSASCSSGRSGRRWAPCWRGCSTDGAHHRLVDLVCDRAYDWVTANHDHRAADRRAAGADLVAPLRRRDHRRPGLPRGRRPSPGR